MKNKLTIMLVILALAIGSLSMTENVQAKAYKTKTVKVTKGKSKTVKTKKKIKKVKISGKNKKFTVKKTANKKFKVSKTDVGKTQTVKVTYTNGDTQKFKIKTVKFIDYKKKVVKEVKALMADPDKGLRTALADWKKKRQILSKNATFYLWIYGENGLYSQLTVDEVIKNYTPSQKKALILEAYCHARMKYSKADKYNNNAHTYERLYKGTFKGVCADGAYMGYDLAKALGLTAKYTGSMEINHGWCVIKVTDKTGTSYWHGVYTTSRAYNMKGFAPIPNGWTMTEKQVEKWKLQPNTETCWRISYARRIRKPTTTPKPAPKVTQTPVQTPVPTAKPTPKPTPRPTPKPWFTLPPELQEDTTPTPEPAVTPTPEFAVEPTETPAAQRIIIPHDEHNYTCPGCDEIPYRHKKKDNPYVSNFTNIYVDYTVYEHRYNGTLRYFDADGNEYIDINNDGDIMDELAALVG